MMKELQSCVALVYFNSISFLKKCIYKIFKKKLCINKFYFTKKKKNEKKGKAKPCYVNVTKNSSI